MPVLAELNFAVNFKDEWVLTAMLQQVTSLYRKVGFWQQAAYTVGHFLFAMFKFPDF